MAGEYSISFEPKFTPPFPYYYTLRLLLNFHIINNATMNDFKYKLLFSVLESLS